MSSAGAGLADAGPFAGALAGDDFDDIAFAGGFPEAIDFADGFSIDLGARCGFTDFDAFVVVATATDAVPLVLPVRAPPVALPVARAPGARMVLLDIGPLLDQLPR
jgi:hypothetical protein